MDFFQFQSDILGKIVRRPLIRETTALGSYLASLAVGFWKDKKKKLWTKWNVDNEYKPNLDIKTREKLYAN